MKNRNKVVSCGALLVVAAAYWTHLGLTAYYTSTHARSTDDTGAFSDFRLGSAFLLAFVATGVCLSHHRAGALVLRSLVVIVSLVGTVFTARNLSQAFTPPPYVHGIQFFSYATGLALLLAYFALTLVFALPFVSPARVFRLRYLLHFGLFPVALFMAFLIGMPEAYGGGFLVVGLDLLAGLPLILLSFRAYELRFTTGRNA